MAAQCFEEGGEHGVEPLAAGQIDRRNQSDNAPHDAEPGGILRHVIAVAAAFFGQPGPPGCAAN